MLWILSIGAVINLTGMSFLWPMNTIYINQILGKSLQIAGLVLLFQQAAAIVGNILGGMLFDRFGGRKTIILGIFSAMVIVFGMGWVENFLYYAVLMTLLGFCFGITFPAMNALATAVWPEGGRKAINVIYVSQNLGVALGSALGGFLASVSFQWVFFGNALTYAMFLTLFVVVFKEHRLAQEPELASSSLITRAGTGLESASNGQKQGFVRMIPLGLLGIGFVIGWMAYVQWQSTIAVHIQTLGIALAAYSVLWTLNGTVIVLGQPISSWFINRFATTLKKQIIIGVIIYALAMAIAGSSVSYYGFVLAMIIMTFGEMLVWPGVPSLAADMAPKGRSGMYQGIVSSAATGGRMLGPLFGAMLFERFSPEIMFTTMVVLCLVSALCFYAHDKLVKPSKLHSSSNQISA